METKNPMADAFESQAKTISNIVETSKKLQESVLKGEMFEKGADIYKAWLDKQKGIIEETLNSSTATPKAEPAASTSAAATDVFQEWTKMQTNFFKAWVDAAQQVIPKAPAAPTVPGPEAFFQETKRMYDTWSGIYQQWVNQATSGLGGMRSFMAGNMGQNPMSDMMNASHTYMKMYEVWQPLMQMMQSNIKQFTAAGADSKFDLANFAQAFSPEKYKEVLDSIFRFMPNEQMKAFYEQISNMTHQSFGMGKSIQEQYSSYMKQFAGAFTPATWDSLNFANNPFMRQMEQTMAPLQKLMPAGKEKEMMEAAKKLQEKFVAYWQKSAEMQYMVYTAGQKSLEKIMDETLEKARGGDMATAMNYTEFFNQWLNTTETIMIEMFGSDEFSRVQGEVLTLGLEIKRLLEQQMEAQLAPYPVVTRSEADELIETIHELRNRIRKLEKALGRASEEDTEADRKGARRTTKSKA